MSNNSSTILSRIFAKCCKFCNLNKIKPKLEVMPPKAKDFLNANLPQDQERPNKITVLKVSNIIEDAKEHDLKKQQPEKLKNINIPISFDENKEQSNQISPKKEKAFEREALLAQCGFNSESKSDDSSCISSSLHPSKPEMTNNHTIKSEVGSIEFSGTIHSV